MILRHAATLVYRLALLAFPSGHRADFGAEMIDTFERELAARIQRDGGWRALRFVVAAWLDAVSAGLGERRYQRRRRAAGRGGAMPLAVSWLDVKLGLRMLVRYPGLSLVGGLGIVLVVVCGTAAGIFHAVVNGSLPFEDGNRVVAIENWDAGQNKPAVNDFIEWRDGVKTIRDIGAYRLVSRNVGDSSRAPEPERIAQISAAAFKIARVPPMLGRYLVPEDELAGAAPVIVVGHDEWQRRFAGDPELIGRTLEVGDTATTVVGIMPGGFGFPVNEQYWMPLRLDASAARLSARGVHSGRIEEAPSSMPYKYMPQGVLNVFGRLADGATIADAQAELGVIGQRAAAESPATHARIRPRVYRYTWWFFREQHDGEIYLVQGLIALLLGIVGANVAVLVYARTATRQVEIALRSALGASRLRIVGQMFAEGLVLSAAAAAVGFGIAGLLRRELDGFIGWQLAPFWVDSSVTSWTVIAYVIAVAVFGAMIVGVVPALQATGRRAKIGLQQAAAGSSAWRIGRTYAVLIVVQVALAVAILPYALATAWTSLQEAIVKPGFAANEFLTARLDMERDAAAPARIDPADDAGLRNLQAELARRLTLEPGVSDVAFLAGVPGSEPTSDIDVEGAESREVGMGLVGVDVFKTLGIPIVAGRSFDVRDVGPSNAAPASHASPRYVIVNRTFAQKVIGGNALGRRVRDAGAPGSGPGPWLEIVGVVEDFPATPKASTHAVPRLYQAVDRGDPRLGVLALRIRGGAPTAFAGRLREITTALDRRLMLRDVRAMDAALQDQRIGAEVAAWAAGLTTMSLLLLSATGLYALMAFTVTQRRREIGIRVALGANARSVIQSILSRALWQLGVGTAIGVAFAAALNDATRGDFTGGAGLRILPVVAAFVLLVGLCAAAAPARRGLRIQPTEAMREQ